MTTALDRLRDANPVPDDVLDDRELRELRIALMQRTASVGQRRRLRQPGRRRWAAAVAVVALTAAVVGVVTGVFEDEEPTPIAASSREERAIHVAGAFLAATDAGDTDAGLRLLQPNLRRDPMIIAGVEFLAALPGSKTLSECTTEEMDSAIGVSCVARLDGPIFAATGWRLGHITFVVADDGLLSAMPELAPRFRAQDTFVEYARLVAPEAFSEVCLPGAYDEGTVRFGRGHVWSGPCGEFWASLADDAAAWVEDGRPTPND